MLTNYYLLHQVVAELSRSVVGSEFLGSHSVHADELQLVFGDVTVVALLAPSKISFYQLSQEAKLPKRNVLSFFGELEGMTLKEIAIEHDDKIITFHFGELLLLLRFFDSPNALLIKDTEVIASFKKEHERKARESKPVIADHSASAELRRHLPMLGKHLEREYFARYDRVNDVSVQAFDSLLRNSKHSTLYRRGEELLLSPIELHSIADSYSVETITSTSQAIEFVLSYRHKTIALTSRKHTMRATLNALLGRTAKATNDAVRGIAESERAERYRAIADAIQTQAYELPKGSTTINFEFAGIPDSATLDPKKTIYENSARYYEQSRHSLETKALLSEKLIGLERNTIALTAALVEIDECHSMRELDAFEKKMQSRSFLLEKSDESAERSGDDLDRFRRFTVAGGFEVLAGKNAKQNDELTMKIAAKEDLWFHARHVSGSHVVLRTAGKKEIPHEAIIHAAEIAAFYSDAKTQTTAPVAYTKRKFVRKSKGAALGAVKLEREEVVMVQPKEH